MLADNFSPSLSTQQKLLCEKRNEESEQCNKQDEMAKLKDQLMSLNYRLTEAETALARKIDRNQCLTILERRISYPQMKSLIDSVEQRMIELRAKDELKTQQFEMESKKKLNELAKKLGKLPTNCKKIHPQQLYLQSNETIFGMLVQQITKIRDMHSDIQTSIEHKHRKVVSLNNEVCRKIQKLQAEIEETCAKIDIKSRESDTAETNKQLTNTWSQSGSQKIRKGTYKSNTTNLNHSYEEIRLKMIGETLEALQTQMLLKINIRDVGPLLLQTANSMQSEMRQLRQFVSQNLDSTRKILTHQSQINQQICGAMKIGCWHSSEIQRDFWTWKKQVCNLVPEVFECNGGNSIKIMVHGNYLLKVLTIFDNQQKQQNTIQVLVNMQIMELMRESVLKMNKNTEIRIIARQGTQVYLFLQKL